jgi:hypothetical protein
MQIESGRVAHQQRSQTFQSPEKLVESLRASEQRVIDDTSSNHLEVLFTDRVLLSPEATAILDRLYAKMLKERNITRPERGPADYSRLLRFFSPGIVTLVLDLIERQGDFLASGLDAGNDGAGIIDDADPSCLGDVGLSAPDADNDGELLEGAASCVADGIAAGGNGAPDLSTLLLILRAAWIVLRFFH